jgi:hypothetical protein
MWHFFGEMCAEPLLVYFSNTFKYDTAHETITRKNAFLLLKKAEYEEFNFPCRPLFPFLRDFGLPGFLLPPENAG